MQRYYATMSVLAVRVALTLLLAFAAAQGCVVLRTPIPWMLGPLVAVSLASIARLPTRSFAPFRNAGQCVIGTALGLYFTAQVTALVASLWWAIVLAVVWALALGWGAAAWLYHRFGDWVGGDPHERRATCFFASAIGGASEMTLLAEREGARTDLVAASHTVRILVVTVCVPAAVTALHMQGIDTTLPGPRVVHYPGLVLLLGASLVGCWLMKQTGRANPWFLGALIVAMGLTVSGVELSAMPQWLSNAAQLVIGVSLGVRFQPEFLQAAPRWLLAIALSSLGLIAACAGFALLLGLGTHLHPATMVLATAPGGIAEMAITAKVLQLGVPVVTALQVCRVIAVLVLVEPLFRRLYRVNG